MGGGPVPGPVPMRGDPVPGPAPMGGGPVPGPAPMGGGPVPCSRAWGRSRSAPTISAEGPQVHLSTIFKFLRLC
jgi:hypothetical protein